MVRIAPADLNRLLTTLEVNTVSLAECQANLGHRIVFSSADACGLIYHLAGPARVSIGALPPLVVPAHTLIILPPERSLRIEVAAEQPTTVKEHWLGLKPGSLHRVVAGVGEPQVMMICGYFRALYGGSVDLFATLTNEIIETFDITEEVGRTLKAAQSELAAQQVGTDAMASALMKQVLVTLLRRSLRSANLWVERLPLLGDPQIARAFAEMAARPHSLHSVHSLAQTACLSRSAFMARFTRLFGKSPMLTLRNLRMRQAAILLEADTQSVEQIAHGVGYASRSSFLRAFRKTCRDQSSDSRV